MIRDAGGDSDIMATALTDLQTGRVSEDCIVAQHYLEYAEQHLALLVQRAQLQDQAMKDVELERQATLSRTADLKQHVKCWTVSTWLSIIDSMCSWMRLVIATLTMML
jgi:hypothetical protein